MRARCCVTRLDTRPPRVRLLVTSPSRSRLTRCPHTCTQRRQMMVRAEINILKYHLLTCFSWLSLADCSAACSRDTTW